MAKLIEFKGGGQSTQQDAQELGDKVKALVYEYAGRMLLPTAVGTLYVVAAEIMQESE